MCACVHASVHTELLRVNIHYVHAHVACEPTASLHSQWDLGDHHRLLCRPRCKPPRWGSRMRCCSTPDAL